MKYRIVFYLGLLWMGGVSVVQAQDLCLTPGGGFSINGIAGNEPAYGCAPFIVNLRNTVPGALNLKYDFDYKGGDGSSASPTDTYTYTKPGTYRILQVGSSGATGIAACRLVIVRSTTPPNFQLTACADNLVKLTIVRDSIANQYDQFEVIWNDNTAPQTLNKQDSLTVTHAYRLPGTYSITVRGIYSTGGCAVGTTNPKVIQLVQTPLSSVSMSELQARTDGSVALTFTGIVGIESEVLVKTGNAPYAPIGVKNSQGGIQTLTLPALDPKQVHCLKMRTTDACGNTAESNAMCTMLLSGTAENERNVLTWNQTIETQGFRNYILTKDGVIMKQTTDFSDISYIDNDVICGATYRYQLVATSDKGRSISAPVQVTARSDSKPGAIEGALVNVEPDGSVSVIGLIPTVGASPSYKMIFERSDTPTGGFREVGISENQNRYTDIAVNTSERSYCYRISYENACGNRSDPSKAICTIFLRQEGSAIRWTTDSPFIDAVGAYSVIRLDQGVPTAEVDKALNNTHDPSGDATDDQQFSYQVRARSQNGSFQSSSNEIVYRREAAIYLPDAFTPDGNGPSENEVFRAKGRFLDKYQMIIYNRWGQSIFQTTDLDQGWDGTINGEKAPVGYYVYKVITTDSTGREFVKSGTFLLLR